MITKNNSPHSSITTHPLERRQRESQNPLRCSLPPQIHALSQSQHCYVDYVHSHNPPSSVKADESVHHQSLPMFPASPLFHVHSSYVHTDRWDKPHHLLLPFHLHHHLDRDHFPNLPNHPHQKSHALFVETYFQSHHSSHALPRGHGHHQCPIPHTHSHSDC